MKTLCHFFACTLALVTFQVSSAQAQTAPTVINQIPYTINSSGNYVLNGNFSYAPTSGYAITVNAPNVTINFNGYYISNRAAGSSSQAGGVFLAGVNNVTITNGTLSGFSVGIFADETGSETGSNYGHVFENMRLINQTNYGIELVNSNSSCIIQNCQVIGTGGSGVTNAYGIYVNSPNVTTEILNNSVSGVTATNAYGIDIINGQCFLKDNHVANVATGFFMTSQCKYLDNLTYGCTTAFTGGTAVGSNN